MFSLVSPGSTRLGWIGTGVMGKAMCQRLMAAGYRLSVHTRTESKARELVTEGATLCPTPRAVAECSDVVVSMLGYPNDVRQVILEEGGVLDGLRSGSLLIDMTTSQPALAVEIAQAAHARGVVSLDAPVSGGDVGARNGTLSIMVGGPAEGLEAVRPIFDVLGKTVVHQGPAGAGQRTKLVNQMLIGPTMIAICEALLFAKRSGLQMEQVLSSVAQGAAGSWALQNLAPRMLKADFEPGFFVEHFVKDLRLALDEAERYQLELPGLSLAKELYESLLEAGHGRCGTQALMLELERRQS